MNNLNKWMGILLTFCALPSYAMDCKKNSDEELLYLNEFFSKSKPLSLIVHNDLKKEEAKLTVAYCYHGQADKAALPSLIILDDPYKSLKTIKGFDSQGYPLSDQREGQFVLKPGYDTVNWIERDYNFEPQSQGDVFCFDGKNAYVGKVKVSTEAFLKIFIDEKAIHLYITSSYEPLYGKIVDYSFEKGPSLLKSPPLLQNLLKTFGTACLSQGFRVSDYLLKLDGLYKTNIGNLDKLDPKESIKIPLVTHTIFTSTNDLFLDYVRFLENSVKKCPDWTHNLWVLNKKDFLAKNPDFLTVFPSLQLIEISELKNTNFKKYAQALIDEGLGRLASKILRYAILDEKGGVFRGTGFEFLHNLKRFHQAFDFYAGLDGKNLHLPGSGIVASTPGHNVVKATLKQIESNLTNLSSYLKNWKDPSYDPNTVYSDILLMSKGYLAISLMLEGGKKSDILMPPPVFSPVKKDPKISHAEHPNASWPLSAYGVEHGHRGWWVDIMQLRDKK